MLKNSAWNRRSFSTLGKLWDKFSLREDKTLWNKATADAKRHESPFPVVLQAPHPRETKVTRLSNGVRVVSETPALPGVVTMAVMLEVGTRNETKESSGALFSIQSTKLKTNLHTNETINNHMVMMTGGDYDVTYDRERTLFKASCLAHDVQDVFGMVSDCVLEPRSSVTANAAISKMKELRKVSPYKYPGIHETDQLFAGCFGNKGLGMPLQGTEKNDVNLTAYALQKFQMENYSPERVIIGGVNIENHGEFVGLVEEYFGNLRYGSSLSQPEHAVFKEAELKITDTESNKNEVMLVFETAPNSSRDFLLAALAREYFGFADVGTPSSYLRNNGVFVSEFYNKEKALHAAEALNFGFNDVGLFGFRIATASDGTNRVLDSLFNHLQKVDKASELFFIQAVKRLRNGIVASTENDCGRLKELLHHVSVFGEFRLEKLLAEIDALTPADLHAFLKKTVAGKAAILSKGPSAGTVHSLEHIKRSLK